MFYLLINFFFCFRVWLAENCKNLLCNKNGHRKKSIKFTVYKIAKAQLLYTLNAKFTDLASKH